MSKENSRDRLTICICGMAGSGKSTLAKKLARRYGFRYYSGGDALKALAAEEGYKPAERGWWESREGLRFLKKRKEDSQFDKKVDKKLLELARQGNVVLDSWTMPWLHKGGFKIWLEASLEKRAERIAKRDKTNVEQALRALESKERQTKAIYKELYDFDLGKDFTPFKLILDTDCLEAGEVLHVLCAVVDNTLKNSKGNETSDRSQKSY